MPIPNIQSGYIKVDWNEVPDARTAESQLRGDMKRVVNEKLEKVETAAEQARSIVPFVLAQVAAYAFLSHLHVFSALRFLNWNVTNYVVPAATAVGANAIANKLAPVSNFVGSCAAKATNIVGTTLTVYNVPSQARKETGLSYWRVLTAAS